MQQRLPITIAADGQFSKSLNPLLTKLEKWINFQALKADWYSNENRLLSFDFTLIKNMEKKTQDLTSDNWIVEPSFAYHYNHSSLTTIAFVAVDDLVKNSGIEQAIKARLTDVANIIALQNGFLPLP